MTIVTAIFPCCAGVWLFLEAMCYGRMPFLTPTLVASYDTQGYGTPILTGAYTGDQYTGTHFADLGRMTG